MSQKKHKKLIIAAVFVSLFAIGFAVLPGGRSRAQSDLVSTQVAGQGTPAAATTGREILMILEDLKKITLNTAIFDDNAFKSLKDFRVTLPEEDKQRPNPFAPIGKDDLPDSFVAENSDIPPTSAETGQPSFFGNSSPSDMNVGR